MTNEQRRKFWAMLADISRQVPLVIDGQPVMAHREDWRLVFCSGLMNETRIADGLDGQKVVLGLRLRDIFKGLDDDAAKRLASDLIMLVEKFCADHNVILSDPKESALREQWEQDRVIP